jgi:rhamnosyltransferase subunit B
MSARIVLAAFGSLGDIHPTMALALELQRRGHEAIIATSELYRSKIEGEGLKFHATRPDLPPPRESHELIRRVADARSGTQYLFSQLLMPRLRNAYDDLLPVARECDLLISHPATCAAPLVARSLNRKWLSIALAPISIWSVYDPPVLANLPALTRLNALRKNLPLQRVFKRFAQGASRLWIRPVLDLGKELGLPNAGHPLFEGQHSPYGVLALFSKSLATRQLDWPARTHICGACYYDKRGEFKDMTQEYSGPALVTPIREFLSAGEKPIVFTLGSSAVFDARDFYEVSTQAARLMKRRALLLIGEEANRPRSLLCNNNQIAAFEYAPYGELFSQAAAVVHVGGAGTVARVLESGAPSLVMPFGNDQFDNAARLERLQIARTIARAEYSDRSAAQELSALSSDPIYTLRAFEIAHQVRKENGAQAAADVIENVLRS